MTKDTTSLLKDNSNHRQVILVGEEGQICVWTSGRNLLLFSMYIIKANPSRTENTHLQAGIKQCK